MLKYSKAELNRQAKELGFVRDTFERYVASQTFLPLWRVTRC